jgi:hypothetical protein
MAEHNESARMRLSHLDSVEAAARSQVPACAGCTFYWEDPEGPPRGWGWCRRAPPTLERQHEIDDALGCPTVAFNWYCGEFRRGCHPAVAEQRKLWREEIVRELRPKAAAA